MMLTGAGLAALALPAGGQPARLMTVDQAPPGDSVAVVRNP